MTGGYIELALASFFSLGFIVGSLFGVAIAKGWRK